MKSKLVLVLMVATIVGSFKAATAQNKNKEKDAITVKVDDSGCTFCAYTLEKKFKELKVV